MSSQRIDYYDSPEAPKAKSLVPAVNVVVVNDADEILLIRAPTTATGPSPAARSTSASPSPDETCVHGMQKVRGGSNPSAPQVTEPGDAGAEPGASATELIQIRSSRGTSRIRPASPIPG
jgi:hypothetical protein